MHLLKTNGNSRNADLANYDCLRALFHITKKHNRTFTKNSFTFLILLASGTWEQLPTCCSKDIVHKPLLQFRPTDKEVCRSSELCLLLTWPYFQTPQERPFRNMTP